MALVSGGGVLRQAQAVNCQVSASSRSEAPLRTEQGIRVRNASAIMERRISKIKIVAQSPQTRLSG